MSSCILFVGIIGVCFFLCRHIFKIFVKLQVSVMVLLFFGTKGAGKYHWCLAVSFLLVSLGCVYFM